MIHTRIGLILALACVAAGLLGGCHAASHSDAAKGGAAASTVGPRFAEVARPAGLDYTWTVEGKRPLNILQTIGHGCGFLDYDGDGNLDILLVGTKLALYKGDGHGHFTDVTRSAGLDKLTGRFLGCAVGDYDNDGYDDVYLSAFQGGALLHNDHGRGFSDASRAAGIAPQPWSTSAEFVDIDGDGKLDLFIGNYVKFGPNVQPQLCSFSGIMSACGPGHYEPNYGVLYRNLGGGRFADVTKAWNARNVSGKVLGVAAGDFDGSGRQSLYLANDAVPGNLLKNVGGRFTDIGASSGTSTDPNGNSRGGMGVDWGDYDNDGKLDLAIGAFDHQPNAVYHNDGNGLFSEESGALGVGTPTTPLVTFGTKWLDVDNDGWLDLIFASGHVQDNVAPIDPNETYREPTLLFHNEGSGQRLADISAAALAGGAGQPIVGRGLAVGDYDNDGREDVLIVDNEGKPLLLHNETLNAGHWLEILLVGTKSNRDGQGAMVTVDTGAAKLVRPCSTGGSYESASDRRVHVGLGTAGGVRTLTVRWPSGHVDTYGNVAADRIVTVREGSASLAAGR